MLFKTQNTQNNHEFCLKAKIMNSNNKDECAENYMLEIVWNIKRMILNRTKWSLNETDRSKILLDASYDLIRFYNIMQRRFKKFSNETQ